MGGGGILETLFAMAVTYSAGLLSSVTSSLGEVWAHVTPGQAALVVGLLTYFTHNGPRFVRWARALPPRGKVSRDNATR
jgi:hypothetical protein